MIKKILPVLLILTFLFNINVPVIAASNETEHYTISQTPYKFITSEKKDDNAIITLFSPDEHNLDTLLGVTLSVVPGFGVGHFWLGNENDGWSFFKLDLIMLAIPLAIASTSTIFSSLGIIKSDTMNSVNVFSILGLISWASSLGIKIWETASVWKYINDAKKNEKKLIQ